MTRLDVLGSRLGLGVSKARPIRLVKVNGMMDSMESVESQAPDVLIKLPESPAGAPAEDPAGLAHEHDPGLNHESPGETANAPQGTRFEKIRDGGRRLFEKWNVPFFSKSGATAETTLGEAQAATDTPPVLTGDSLVIRRSMSAIGKAVRKGLDKTIYRKALEASDGDREWAEEYRRETSATDEECDALGEVTQIVLRELGMEAKYLPLLASGVLVVAAGTRYTMAVGDLNKKIRIKEARKAPIK